ncbi:MAG: indolepyruvate ferredoxin oxidoreductase subunit alpha, partial [Spirochaetales bacterium]|nr:indolepyruvate ferredoxin oxidoreductase subunit alpha [Spirochaetales bacterium]
IAVIGDSTFFHSGITGLINVMYSSTPLVVIILDNRITAMTGHQHNPGTGFTLQMKKSPEVDIPRLVSALGFSDEQISVINPHNLEDGRTALKKAMDYSGPYVIITKSPCALLPEVREISVNQYYSVDRSLCIGCKACIRTGCPSISIKNNKSSIDPNSCASCGVCMQACNPGAISGPYAAGGDS